MTQLDALKLHNARYGRIYFSFKSDKLKINHSLSSIVFDTTKVMNNTALIYTIKSSNLGDIVFDFSQKIIQYIDLEQNAHTLYSNDAWSTVETDNTAYSYNPTTGQFKFKELFHITELAVNPMGASLDSLHDLDAVFLLCNLTTNTVATTTPVEP
jgi:hypothetical protein